VDGKLCVAGGQNDVDGALSSVECFDPSTGQWSAAAAMTTARVCFCMASLECPE
jgi:hypothetical protein